MECLRLRPQQDIMLSRPGRCTLELKDIADLRPREVCECERGSVYLPKGPPGDFIQKTPHGS